MVKTTRRLAPGNQEEMNLIFIWFNTLEDNLEKGSGVGYKPAFKKTIYNLLVEYPTSNNEGGPH